MIVLTVLALSSGFARVQGNVMRPSQTEVSTAPVRNGANRLDGNFDEPAWVHAPAIALMQQDPHPGEPTPNRTTLRLLADRAHLYLAVSCVDPAPDRLSVHTLERDSDQTNDDHFTIVLDTFGHHRLSYVFQVNVGGAHTDGLISPASSLPNYDWDGIWNARVRRSVNGWTAEIEIDTRSLQLLGGRDRWDFNVQRYVLRNQLSLQWASIALDSSIFDLARTGVLSGVGVLKQGHGLDVASYVSLRHDSTGSRSSAQVGGDVRHNLTPSLAVTVTLNPDFAEAEADADQINLMRFSLFFTEKRHFFSEGSNLFTFGAGLTDNNTFLPFYSRRIGLVNGQIVRVDSGIKIVGSAGPWSIGVLDVETGPSSISGPTRLFAGRLIYDITEHLRVGTLLRHGDPTGRANNSLTGTLEGKLRFELSNETNFGYLPQGNVIQRLYQFKTSYSFSPDLIFSTFAQYDSDIAHTGLNARLHWIVASGRDFFLVLNHRVEASVTDPRAPSLPISNVVIAKLRWDFRR